MDKLLTVMIFFFSSTLLAQTDRDAELGHNFKWGSSLYEPSSTLGFGYGSPKESRGYNSLHGGGYGSKSSVGLSAKSYSAEDIVVTNKAKISAQICQIEIISRLIKENGCGIVDIKDFNTAVSSCQGKVRKNLEITRPDLMHLYYLQTNQSLIESISIIYYTVNSNNCDYRLIPQHGIYKKKESTKDAPNLAKEGNFTSGAQ